MIPTSQQIPNQQNPLMGQSAPQLGMQQGNMLAQPVPPTPQQIEEAIKHNGNLGGILADLLAKPNASSKDVLTGMTDAMRMGSFTPQEAAQAAAKVPTEQAQIKPYLMQHFIQNMSIGKQLRAMRIPPSA